LRRTTASRSPSSACCQTRKAAKEFIRNPVEGLLGLAVFGVIIGFAVWARIAKRWQERCLALLGAMMVMGIALVAGAAYRHLS
jgi:hypothetical protein